ncbi:hypothetical protein KSS87_012869 [Heliosperma pusillum]|nr:hypothetical protein KSS87_012869 [Heliosperma pusillum]
MARNFPIQYIIPINIITMSYIFIVILATMSIFALVNFLCASHNNEKQKEVSFKNTKFSISKKNLLASFDKASYLSNKAIFKMKSWRKPVQHEEDDYIDINVDNDNNINNGFDEEDEIVWKKTIIKGEKCRPLDFSGKIEYDSEGNLLPDVHKCVANEKIISCT